MESSSVCLTIANEKWIPYPSLRVKQEEERGDQKESEEYLHVVR
jgi:hypothetical protein